MPHLFKALGAALVLTGLLVGVPWLLLLWGRLGDLSSIDWAVALAVPDDGRLTLGLMSLVGWIAWGALVLITAGELARMLSQGRIRLSLPGTGWLRPLIGALLAMALSPVLTANANPTGPSAVVAASPQQQPAESPTEPVSPKTSRGQSWREYEVQLGDELWDIAVRELGGGQRWRELAAANPGLDIDAPLVPGTLLRVPGTVTVAPGDSLWALSAEHLGDPERWPELHAANQDQISDPDQIDTGWVLTLPGADVAGDAPPLEQRQAPTTPAETAPPTPSPEPIPTPATAPALPTPADTDPADTELESDPDLSHYLGTIGGLLAAGIVAGVSLRRRAGLHQRPLGRRLLPLTPSLTDFWTALGIRGSQGSLIHQDPPSPTTVLLGWRDEQEIWFSIEEQRCLWVRGPDSEVLGLAAAVWTSLLTADWSAEVELVAVHPAESWGEAMDDPRLDVLPTADQALTDLRTLCARRRVALGVSSLDTVRADPDRAADFAPVVFVFCEPLSEAEAALVAEAMDLGPVGVSVIAPTRSSPPGIGQHLNLTGHDVASLGHGRSFSPQLIPAPARRALVGLFAASIDTTTQPAPWWRDAPPPDDVALPAGTLPRKDTEMAPAPQSPTLLLLGEVDLVACDGQRPSRAVGRCLECCAWLLAHPGATPTEMRESLMVAETTRRSNMSRLRSWLGEGPSGEHLPDAYSGRIQLAETVSSDWERFQSLVAGGANHTGDRLLAEALSLVRGAPLGSFEFQWGWAEQLRSDIVSMIIDVAAVLADRCLARRDHETASWALDKGILAAGDVEPLVVRRIRLLAQLGDRSGVDRQVLQLTRAARAAGRDLGQQSVRMIQDALHLSHTSPSPDRAYFTGRESGRTAQQPEPAQSPP